jgi:hypothetical protein
VEPGYISVHHDHSVFWIQSIYPSTEPPLPPRLIHGHLPQKWEETSFSAVAQPFCLVYAEADYLSVRPLSSRMRSPHEYTDHRRLAQRPRYICNDQTSGSFHSMVWESHLYLLSRQASHALLIREPDARDCEGDREVLMAGCNGVCHQSSE